ncbi:MAG: sodium:proton antiporter [Ignavibacteriae bacterium]|nr:MAG: sodium:proton antiporter [Ignavibacteriota bacterium]
MEVNIFSILPFIILLLAIAIAPFIDYLKWENNYHIVSVSLGAVIVIYYLFLGKGGDVLHTLEEYIMFISLLASLFIISGGVFIDIKGLSTPFRNVILLAIGAVIANIFGTTGASMLLIRPYINTNKIRISAYHIIFFIFIVSNVGGALTPIGDPPLFLGYLKGIPFFWIINKVIVKWAITVSLLLIIFYILDRYNFKKQPDYLEIREIKQREKIKVSGIVNIFLLFVVIGSVFITEPVFLREAIMLITAFVSYKITKKEIHIRNRFSFHPIKEVAWLFIGIFMTMMPALDLLSKNSTSLGLSTPGHYYWTTGILSSFLDNAPTYLTFLTASMGLYGLDINNIQDVLTFIVSHEKFVVAISISSVFFGAMTYIGNGPNFMVKSIAEHNDVKTSSFFGYMIKYSIPILIPIYILIWLLFI